MVLLTRFTVCEIAQDPVQGTPRQTSLAR